MTNNRYSFAGKPHGSLVTRRLSPQIQRKLRLAVPMVLYMLFYCAGFLVIENWNRLHYTVIHTAVDDMIPFCEWFVIPYLLWFLYVSGFTLYMLFTDEKSYHEICTYLAIGMTVFLVVSAVFPNILFLRPQTMPRDNVLTRICGILYAADTPTNVTPSIHVYNSIAVMIAAVRTDAKLFRSWFSKTVMAAIGLSIILATMFLKQHSFSDVVIATGLALCCYILVYKLEFVFIPEHGIRFRGRSVRRRARRRALSA